MAALSLKLKRTTASVRSSKMNFSAGGVPPCRASHSQGKVFQSILKLKRTTLALLGLCAVLCFASGCDKTSETSTSQPANAAPPNVPVVDFSRTLTDARGKTITIKAQPKRIVSLSPATTELLFALGLGSRIVGVTTACDYPPEAAKKPKIGGAYDMSVEKVQSQTPDLVIAFGAVNQKPIEAMEAANLTTLVVDAKTVAEIYTAIRLLGKATGTEEQAEKLAGDMEKRLTALQKATANYETKPGVLIVHDVNPIYTTGPGSYIDEAIAIAGGKNVIDATITGTTLSPEKGVELVPDVIICAPELRVKLRAIPGWAQGIPAVMGNRYFSPSEAGTLTRPGPRLTKAIEELARYLHPDIKTP